MDLILGYAGAAFSGKDTASKLLKKCLRKRFSSKEIKDEESGLIGEVFDSKIIVWHTPLALAVKSEFVDEQKLLGKEISLTRLLYDEEYKSNFRKDLIRIGDGRREEINPLYWIYKSQEIVKKLRVYFADYINIVNITDMRYENEVPEFEEYCYKEDGVSMLSSKINTSLLTILSRMPEKDGLTYLRTYRLNKSERNVKKVKTDIQLDNNKSVKNLEQQIEKKTIPLIEAIIGYKIPKLPWYTRLIEKISNMLA